MVRIEDFFFDKNRVDGITEADYERARPYVEAAQAFAHITYQSIYVIDYFRKNFLYVSDNPIFLCGHTAEEVLDMGYGFYLNNVPAEELPMLTELNRAGFAAFGETPKQDRQRCVMSYDFHIITGGRRLLINHKITPLVLLDDGRVWLAVCTVSLSSHKEAGHIELRLYGQNGLREYSLDSHQWHQREEITLKPEERTVLSLAAQGYTIKEIADRLCRGVDTVKFHRRNLFDRFGTDNITGAVAFATNYGLL